MVLSGNRYLIHVDRFLGMLTQNQTWRISFNRKNIITLLRIKKTQTHKAHPKYPKEDPPKGKKKTKTKQTTKNLRRFQAYSNLKATSF